MVEIWWIQVVTQEPIVVKIVASKKINNNEHSIRHNTTHWNNILQISFQFIISLFVQFKIITREIQVGSCRVRFSHFLDAKVITIYLISQVADLHIYYQPYFMKLNKVGGMCQFSTGYAQCGTTFWGRVISKIIKIDIQCNTFNRIIL